MVSWPLAWMIFNRMLMRSAAKIAADSKKVENEAWNGEHVKTSLGEAASTATTIKKAIDAVRQFETSCRSDIVPFVHPQLDQDAKKLNIYHSEMDINSHSDIKIEVYESTPHACETFVEPLRPSVWLIL